MTKLEGFNLRMAEKVAGRPAIGGGSVGTYAEAPEFLPLLENLRASEASIDRLFAGEGTRVRPRAGDPRWESRVAEFVELLVEAKNGSARAIYYLTEAQSTSDFPNLFGDVLSRQLLGGYRATEPTYRNYVRIGDVRDFRTVKRFTIDGGEAILTEVPELTEYPEASLADAVFSYVVKKFGRVMPFSWEAFVNDDLGAFATVPERFGRAARRSEERFVTTLFVDANGPHASFYTAGNANIVNAANGAGSNNPALSIAALQGALSVLSRIKDADGEPIMVDAVHLVVPPALEVVAQNILNALQLELVEGGGTANQKLIARNWMAGRTRLSVNPYIPVIASTANGHTSWFLFAEPASGRPALEIGFLRGNTEPAVFRKVSNQERIGGSVSGEQGDFETDALAFKVRHVFGGTRIDPKATVASNGSGS